MTASLVVRLTIPGILLPLLSLPALLFPLGILLRHAPLDGDPRAFLSRRIPRKSLENAVKQFSDCRVEISSCFLVGHELKRR